MNYDDPVFWSGRGGKEVGESSGNESWFEFPESIIPHPTNPWVPASSSLGTVTSVMDGYFPDFVGDFLDPDTYAASSSSAAAKATFLSNPELLPCEHCYGQSSEVKKPDETVLATCPDVGTQKSEEIKRKPDKRPRRSRCGEIRNLAEKTRRARISKRLTNLQEVVPNCNKSTDRASLLEEAVNHIKALTNQVETMSAQRGAICQAPIMPPTPTGFQTIQQVPQYASFVPICFPKQGMDTGLVSVCCSSSHPITTDPTGTLRPSLSAGAGVPPLRPLLPRIPAVPQIQMPVIPPPPPQQMLPAAFDFSGRVESGCQTIPGTSADNQMVPMMNKDTVPSSSSSMPM